MSDYNLEHDVNENNIKKRCIITQTMNTINNDKKLIIIGFKPSEYTNKTLCKQRNDYSLFDIFKTFIINNEYKYIYYLNLNCGNDADNNLNADIVLNTINMHNNANILLCSGTYSLKNKLYYIIITSFKERIKTIWKLSNGAPALYCGRGGWRDKKKSYVLDNTLWDDLINF